MTLAEKVGVSEITIGRFTRKLGYRNFKAMKNELKDSSEAGFPWMVGEQLQHFVETPGLPDEADGSMQREIKSLLAVYRLAEPPPWAAATELLAQSRHVQIEGVQTARGIATLKIGRGA